MTNDLDLGRLLRDRGPDEPPQHDREHRPHVRRGVDVRGPVGLGVGGLACLDDVGLPLGCPARRRADRATASDDQRDGGGARRAGHGRRHHRAARRARAGYDLRGRLANVDVRRMSDQLPLPPLETNIAGQHTVSGAGSRLDASATFDDSTVEGTAVGAGSTGRFANRDGAMRYGFRAHRRRRHPALGQGAGPAVDQHRRLCVLDDGDPHGRRVRHHARYARARRPGGPGALPDLQ